MSRDEFLALATLLGLSAYLLWAQSPTLAGAAAEELATDAVLMLGMGAARRTRTRFGRRGAYSLCPTGYLYVDGAGCVAAAY